MKIYKYILLMFVIHIEHYQYHRLAVFLAYPWPIPDIAPSSETRFLEAVAFPLFHVHCVPKVVKIIQEF